MYVKLGLYVFIKQTMTIWSACILLFTIYSTPCTLVPNRTGSLSLRRRTLYPIELRGQCIQVEKLGEIELLYDALFSITCLVQPSPTLLQL